MTKEPSPRVTGLGPVLVEERDKEASLYDMHATRRVLT